MELNAGSMVDANVNGPCADQRDRHLNFVPFRDSKNTLHKRATVADAKGPDIGIWNLACAPVQQHKHTFQCVPPQPCVPSNGLHA